jgi:hypothetical protein
MDVMRKGLAILAIGFMTAGLGACEDEGPAEEAGESIDETADDVGDAVDEAGDDAEDAADDAAN